MVLGEFPGASYDAWKTRSPDDEYPYDDEEECEPEPCWHDNFDSNDCCADCGQSKASIEAEEEGARQVQAAYERRLRWEHRLRHVHAFRRWLLSKTLDFRLRLNARIWRIKWARKWTRKIDLIRDEEIPF